MVDFNGTNHQKNGILIFQKRNLKKMWSHQVDTGFLKNKQKQLGSLELSVVKLF